MNRLNIIIHWATMREPKKWVLYDRMQPVAALIPSRWPTGQSPWDRAYWLDIACYQEMAIPQSKEGLRLDGLLNQAIGLLPIRLGR